MRFVGTHRTIYAYSKAVYLEPHTIRLRPRSDPRQIVRSFEIDVSPKPDGVTHGLDVWGNDVVWTWFSGSHERLEITTSFDVETLSTNPFDFLVPAGSRSLPPSYPPEERDAFSPYLARPDPDPLVTELANEAAAAADRDVVRFPLEVAVRISDRCELIVRPLGDPLPAGETLATGQGSCRDLAVVFIDACRQLGMPAAFDSGYVNDRPPDQQAELHAWGSVYLPGGGWRGFDPTQGLAVTNGHVTLAAAATPAGAAPLTGSYRSDATAEFMSTIDLRFDD